MSIGNNIKHIRKMMGLSQVELAKATGLSIGTIQGYEQERYKPKEASLNKIAEALECSVNDLRASSVHWAVMQDLLDQITDLHISSLGLDLVEEFNKLNETGQTEAFKRMHELARLPEYKKAP